MKTLKKVEKLPFFTILLSMIICFLYTGRIYAQEGAGGEIDVNIKTEGGGGGELWYNNMWVWVIGIALFIIIIVAIVSAGRKTQ